MTVSPGQDGMLVEQNSRTNTAKGDGMQEQTVKCPKCGFEIPLTEAFTQQIADRSQSERNARVTLPQSSGFPWDR